MHRLLVATELLESDAPVLPKEAQAHLRVLRPREGEEVDLFDGRGRSRVCRFCAGALAPAAAARTFPRPPFGLALFACVTKGSRWDWTVEKATELGVTRIVPVISDRTIVRISPDEREAKRRRWTRIAEDAARQSDAKWIPEIVAPLPLGEALALVGETTCFVGALTAPPPQMLASAVSRTRLAPGSSLALFVGPEGDFTPDELAALTAVAAPVSFGPTILRAETAAVYGLSVLKGFLDVSAR